MENPANLKLVELPPVVETSHLTKRFRGVTALSDVTLSLPPGRIIGLLGPNGSGKTTLIKILAAMYTSYEGVVEIEGARPSHLTKCKVAYLPDKSSFSGEMEVAEILSVYERYFIDFDGKKCEGMLKNFNIEKGEKIRHMSKGVVDKLQVALVMSREAKLFLLDEPIGGVDVGVRDYVLDAIFDNFNSSGTILVATHLVGEMERLFDSAIILEKGTLTDFQDCDRLRQHTGLTLEENLKQRFREGGMQRENSEV